MSEMTNIGDVFYVPTHEIIGELSDDDEYEQKVICFHQLNIVIFYQEERHIPRFTYGDCFVLDWADDTRVL